MYSAYEAGFSGFNLHRELEKVGIKNIVVNAASIAVAANDKVKTDLRDSKKIAEQLSASRLKAIYVPSKDEEARRTLTELETRWWKLELQHPVRLSLSCITMD